jgi:DNA processing protein
MIIQDKWLIAALCAHYGLTTSKYYQILELYPSLIEGLSDNFGLLRESKSFQSWLSKAKIDNTKLKDIEAKISILQEQCSKNNINLLTLEEADYPNSLHILENQKPLCLYYQGNLAILTYSPILTVVGARLIQPYTQQLLQSILSPVCDSQVAVASGLALGVDKTAHQIAINSKAPTIAVLGTSLDDNSFYPVENLRLKEDIINSQQGLVLSEFAPPHKGNRFTFPQRNRILAALSPVTWVAQASLKSGSLITARTALELGQTVCSTPADIFNANYSGNNELLKNGANIITSPADLLDLMHLSSNQLNFSLDSLKHSNTFNLTTAKKAPTTDNPIYNSILHELVSSQAGSREGCNLDFLSEKLNMETSILSEHLTLMELESLVVSCGDNEWKAVD